MKLSCCDISVNLLDEEIQNIVYSNVEDNDNNCTYGIVFGNSMLLKERVNTAE